MRSLVPVLFSITAVAGLAVEAGTINVTGNIAVDTLWTPNDEYILNGTIYVVNGATLTVNPGTVIRGRPRSGPAQYDAGALVVSRGSRIRILGTAVDPVVMTDLNDDNIGAAAGTPPYDTAGTASSITGQWGGLVVLGHGFIAVNTQTSPNPNRQATLPGLSAGPGDYGGCAQVPGLNPHCDEESSGEIHYLTIRYGGAEYAPGAFSSGLTLAGTGRGTEVDHVEVFQPAGDGLTLRGGAARVQHVAVIRPGDDGLDLDEGYRGGMQFVYVQQGDVPGGASDKVFEIGGGVSPPESQPYATPVIYNVTAIGLGGQDPDTAPLGNTAIRFRTNGGGGVFNGAFLDFSRSTACVAGDPNAPMTSANRLTLPGAAGQCTGPASPPNFCMNDSQCTPPSFCLPFFIDSANASMTRQLVLESNTFFCFGQTDQTPGNPASAQAAGCSSQEHYGTINETTVPPLQLFPANEHVPCGSALPIRILDRMPVAFGVDPILVVDPRPAPGSPLLFDDRPTPDDGFFHPAPYRGAFDPESNWLRSWSTSDRLDFFPVPEPTGTLPNGNDVPGNPLEIKVNVADPNLIDLTWGASCSTGADDYSIHEGIIGSFSSHSAVVCSTGGALSWTITPGAGSHYYLVVPVGPESEGGYGTDSSGAARPASTVRCRPITLNRGCP